MNSTTIDCCVWWPLKPLFPGIKRGLKYLDRNNNSLQQYWNCRLDVVLLLHTSASPTQNATSESIISQICGLLLKMFLFHSANSGTSKSEAQLSIQGEFKTAHNSHMRYFTSFTQVNLTHPSSFSSDGSAFGKAKRPKEIRLHTHTSTQRPQRRGGDWHNELNCVYSKPWKSCTLNTTTTKTLIRRDVQFPTELDYQGQPAEAANTPSCYPPQVQSWRGTSF